MGQPTKCTPALRKKICALIEEGNYFYAASEACGINYSTFNNWLKQGREGKEPYVQFLDAVTAAEAIAEARLVQLWSKSAVDNWQAARDLLERRYRERWGKTQAVELSGPQGGPIQTQNVDADITNLMAELATCSEVSTPLETPGQAKPDNA